MKFLDNLIEFMRLVLENGIAVIENNHTVLVSMVREKILYLLFELASKPCDVIDFFINSIMLVPQVQV